MRKIEWTATFKHDFKREKRKDRKLEDMLGAILSELADDIPLQAKYRDHALSGGEWRNSQDCHVKPDLVLIYQKPNDETLLLVRLGSHSELGL